jgi:hypothetical protein
MITARVRDKVRVHLTDPKSCERIRVLSQEAEESAKVYLSQLIETIAVDNRLTTEHLLALDIDREVAAWLEENRSGKIRPYIHYDIAGDVEHTIPKGLLGTYDYSL